MGDKSMKDAYDWEENYREAAASSVSEAEELYTK